mmetsp:Transcript_8542/g.13833  ORF Transcript_8542/g.13833 Transcript_8542/m.13833 type:complete len:320 (+) Transcript_8542:2-961(+)
MDSSSLPTATAVPSCEGEGKSEPTAFLTRELAALDEGDESQEVKHEGGDAPALLVRPHELMTYRNIQDRVRKKTKLLKTINWTDDRYELCVEKRVGEQSGPLFMVFILGEISSGKKFSCVISDKGQSSLHLQEGAPLGLCCVENLCQFMEDTFELKKPELSVSLPEFLECSVSSVSLAVSYDNCLSGYAAVQFRVQVDLALFHNPSEVELTRMVMEKKVGALQEQVAEEASALREEVSSLREMVRQLQAQLLEERARANEKMSSLEESLRQTFNIQTQVVNRTLGGAAKCTCPNDSDPNRRGRLAHVAHCSCAKFFKLF